MVPSEITIVASATDAAIERDICGSGVRTLKFSNKPLNDIIKIDKSLEDVDLFLKCVSETVENEVKEHKGGLH